MYQFFASFRRCRRIGLPTACFNSNLGNSAFPTPCRWISSTSVLANVVQGTSTVSQMDDLRLQQHERNRRISRTLYRQMIRFCQNLLQQGFPKDIVWYYIPTKHYNAPEQVDAFRMEFLYEAVEAIRLLPTHSVRDLEKVTMKYFERMAQLNAAHSEDVPILRRVMQFLPLKVARYEPGMLHLNIFEVEDIMNSVRALFRLNHVVIPDPAVDGEASYESYISYEKERRTRVFEEMKQLNEMYSVLQVLRANREVHSRDKPHVPLSVGQVVQHQQERWRGVIVDWEYHEPSRLVAKPPLSDDFSTIAATSLTNKAYASMTPRISYTIEVDDAYRRKRNNSSTTSVTITEDSANLLSVVTDPHLCRIRNDTWSVHFQGYDLAARRFRLNSRKEFEYPMDFCEGTDSVVEMTRRSEAEEEYGDLLSDIVERVWHFASHLNSIIVQCITEERLYSSNNMSSTPSLSLYQPIAAFHNELLSIFNGSPTLTRLAEGAPFLQSNLCGYLRKLNSMALVVFEAMYLRYQAEIAGEMPFPLGSIVCHKKYGFRGVVVGRDPKPLYDVSRWDGLRDIPNAKSLPFYRIIPDQQDCIEAFGGERPTRYVCEANLEPCPTDRMFLDVNLDSGWIKQSDGSFRAPPLERFKNGADMGDKGVFQRCMLELETELNQWHYLAQVATVPSPDLKSKNGSAPDDTISVSQLLKALQQVDNMDDANTIRETIKLMRKAHKDIVFRSRLEEGVEALIGDNLNRALKIFGKIVVDDPTYVEGWNYLASCYCLMGSYDKAKETIQMVLSLDPNHFHSKSHLALLYYENNEHKEAERCFRECLDLDPWSIVGYKLSECVDSTAKEEKV